MSKNRIRPIIPNTKLRSSISAPNSFPKIGHIIFTEEGKPNPPFTFYIPVIPPTASITSLSCNGIILSPTAATSSIFYTGTATVPYSGGNGISYDTGSSISSTSVLGLTASLQSGTLANGNGNLTYNISGIPSTIGSALFPISFIGNSCTINLTVVSTPPLVTSLDCINISYSPIPTASSVYNGTVTVPYTGGNGISYGSGLKINSTSVLGLTASLQSGTLANGNGNLTYTVTGTPLSTGIANFAISFGGQSCNINMNVSVQLPTIQIGSQVWTTKNLDVITYRDGTPIPEVTDSTEWANLTTGAWCWYNNDVSNSNYGRLYNWYAVAGIYDAASLSNPALRKNIAPVGFHVPTHTEWNTLNIQTGNNTLSLTSVIYGGTNSSGFNALPNGFRGSGTFVGLGNWWEWWTIDIDPTSQNGWPYNIFYNYLGPGQLQNYGWYPDEGAAIRLVKD